MNRRLGTSKCQKTVLGERKWELEGSILHIMLLMIVRIQIYYLHSDTAIYSPASPIPNSTLISQIYNQNSVLPERANNDANPAV